MSTIRPLATITALFAIGMFLWWRINDAPLIEPQDDESGAAADLAAGEDGGELPPLFTADDGSQTPTAPSSPTGAPVAAPSSPIAESPLPDLPALPELPELGAGPPPPIATNPPSTAIPAPDLPLPDNIPMADYDSPTDGVDAPLADVPEVSGSVPSLGTSTPDLVTPPLASTPQPMDDVQIDPAPPSTPLDPGFSPTLAGDEFAQPSSFATAMPGIQVKLDRGDLAGGLADLTEWYGDDSLSPEDQQQLSTLLSQLAGTVVYSTEHLLEQPHVVQGNETLDTIAEQYQVPWQLLAKINGLSDPRSVTTGQQLKVVRGPFNGVLFLGRQEIALDVGGHYAGRFGVTAQGAAASEGEWTVANKLANPTVTGELSKQVILTSSADPSTSVVLTSDANAGGFGSEFKGAIRLAPADEDDLFDILSVGSKVVIRR